jgi:hypothetical protein
LPGCGHIAAELRDYLLNGEIFYSLKEAQIVIEQWRKHYNTIKTESAQSRHAARCENFRLRLQSLHDLT